MKDLRVQVNAESILNSPFLERHRECFLPVTRLHFRTKHKSQAVAVH